jgi:hypothetical protein
MIFETIFHMQYTAKSHVAIHTNNYGDLESTRWNLTRDYMGNQPQTVG